MAVKGFWTENVIDCSKQLLSELEKLALMEDIKLHAGVSFQIDSIYGFGRRSLISSKNLFGLTLCQNLHVEQ